MKCKNCGGELRFDQDLAVCPVCGTSYKIEHSTENIDVAICCIETDQNGRRTKDSIIAQEVYHKLTANKISTFYERISATNIFGDDLELLRYSSFLAAKVLVIVGTNADNFRILSEKFGQCFDGKMVIPLCADMKLSDIPTDLSKIQAVDYSAIGWDKNLERGILRLLGREKEIDFQELQEKKRQQKRILLIAIISVIALLTSAFVIFFIRRSNSEEAISPAEQELYAQAIELENTGEYLAAYDIYTQILNYQDSKERIKAILDQYDGFYQTQDGQFSIRFNIKNSDSLSLEMSSVTQSGVVKADVSGIWNGSKNSYSFSDSRSNSGTISITLKNDGFEIVTQMTDVVDTASIGDRTVTFLVSQKADEQSRIQITRDLLLSWIQTPTTAEDIRSLGLTLEKDDNAAISIGGGVMQKASKYRIADTDIQLFLYAHDTSDEELFYDREKSADVPIVCAISAPAEYVLEDKIGQKAEAFVRDGVLFAPGGTGIYIDWNSSDVCLSFGDDSLAYSPEGKITANTCVGILSSKIVGKTFFMKTVALHTAGLFLTNKTEETDNYCLFETSPIYDPENGDWSVTTCKMDKSTYKIIAIETKSAENK